eukprot:scaffold43806_cov30-Prasinocladus_malaysianus.AAC.1
MGSPLLFQQGIMQPRSREFCKLSNTRRRNASMRVSASRGDFLDYYQLLDVSHDSNADDIKKAYRYLQKRCHPDISGNKLGHEMGILLNEAYSTLSGVPDSCRDPIKRKTFDRLRSHAKKYNDYTGKALSHWEGPPGEQRATFVDEGSCIGCLKCALEANSTFGIEMRYGKARTVTQWGDTEEDIENAISTCPVNCIHWVERSDLPALEYVMRREMELTHGHPTKGGVFDAASAFTRKQDADNGGVDGQAWQ